MNMKKLTILLLLSALVAGAGSCAKNEPFVPSDNPPGKDVTPDPPTPPVPPAKVVQVAKGGGERHGGDVPMSAG